MFQRARKELLRRVLLAGVMPIVGVLVACAPNVDLQAVQQYATATADASSSFSSIAADFSASCLRRRELTLRPADLPYTLIEPAQAYTGAAPVPQTTSTPLGTFNDVNCVNAAAVSEEWDKRNKIVLGYVQALGAIAGVNVQPTFAPLGTALVNAKLITQVQDTAFTTLAQDLSGAIIAGAQREAIAKAVIEVEPSLQTAVSSLKLVDAAYENLLNAEFNETFNFYNSLIRSELPSPVPASLPVMLRDRIYRQRQLYDTSLTDVNAHLTSTVGYANVLDGIAKTHSELYQAAQSKPTIQTYITILQKDVLPLYQDVEALRKVTK